MTTPLAGLAYSTLDDDGLHALLFTEHDRLPRTAVDEFVARGERMVEPLTRILQDEAEWAEDNPAFWRPVHATFILGAIGGVKAITGLLAALEYSNDGDLDWVTEALPSIFAAIGPAAIEPLKKRCRELELDPYERWGIFSALALIAAKHPDRRTELLDFLRAATDDDDFTEEERSYAAFELLDFARPEDRGALIEMARRIGSDRSALFNSEDVDNAYGPDPHSLSEEPRDWLRFYDADEIEARQERWRKEASLDPAVEPDASEFMEDRESPEDSDDAPPPLRADPAAGRNDPCPCGSGKKFKKCCG